MPKKIKDNPRQPGFHRMLRKLRERPTADEYSGLATLPFVRRRPFSAVIRARKTLTAAKANRFGGGNYIS
jgi:hypothetical protein